MAILDTFTGSNGTNINGRTSDSGHTWTTGSNYSIQSNRCQYASVVGGVVLAVLSGGQANDVLTATIRASGVHSFGLIGRYVDASNYWLVVYDWNAGMLIQEVNAGSFITRASNSGNAAPAFNTDFTMTFTFSGTSISASCNGVTISYTSSVHQSATGRGFVSYRDGGTPSGYTGLYNWDGFRDSSGRSLLIGSNLVNNSILTNGLAL